jgi:hypothetical protein
LQFFLPVFGGRRSCCCFEFLGLAKSFFFVTLALFRD